MKHLLVVLMLALSSWARADLVVVVSAANTETLSQAQIAAIYLGKTRSFPGGGRVTALMLDYGSPGLDDFLSAYLGKNLSQYRAIWSRLMFSGEAVAPKVMAGSREVAEAVAENKEAIGIVEAGAVSAKLRVVGKL